MAISTTSFNNTPQATDDLFLASGTGLTEDSTGIVWLAVMANDLGGAAKTLYSLDDGSSSTDLLTKDTARTEALSTDASANGAHIWITNDGRVGYDTATLSPAFVQQLQQLNAGEVLTDSFTYAIRMANGTLSWATAVVQFAGANDAPVVTGTVAGNTVEDGASLTLDALAHASDVDRGSVLQVVDVPATLPPGVTYDAATHSFTLDPSHAAYQHLAANQMQPVTVLYGVSDGTVTTQASVTFTVTGTNDAAQIGAPTATAVTEDTAVGAGGLLAATGTLSISDVDDGEAGFQTAVHGAAGNLGSLSLGADGSYTYSVANGDVQFLGAGQVHEDQFTVRAIDGTSKVLTFTVTGVNDAAVIGDPTNASVTEDVAVSAGALGASGTLSISDVDQGQAAFQTSVTAAAGALGSLTLASDGTYSYSVANADVQFLGASDTHVDTFTVTALDGTTKEVSFTIHGTNDAAVIGDPANASVTEDVAVSAGALGASGTLSISDVDQGQAAFQTSVTAAAGALGSLTLASDGSYSYSVANADVQFLGASDTHVDTFTVTALDGTTKEVSFTIHGTNDAAVIGDPANASVTEDVAVSAGALGASGTLSISDVDQGQAAFQTTVTAAAGALGSLTLASDGTYSYSVANADVQFLGASDTHVDTFTVTALDGTTKEVSFTIHGTNDAAVIGDPANASVTEDVAVSAGALGASGTLSISDVDQGQAAFQTSVTAAAGALGSLTLASDGSYSYSVANADVQFLGASDTHVDTFTVTALDGTTKEVSFTIHGTNDAAVIGDPANASVTEDVAVSAGALGASGTLSISDVDQGQAAFQTTVTAAAGALGSLTLASDGSYSYSVANADVQFLGASDTHVDTFTVTALDGTTKEVSFTIHGTNDAAVIGDPANASVTEDVAVSAGALGASGTLSISDVDQGQAAFQTTVTAAAGALGSLTLASDGTYSYSVANADVQFLGASDTHVDTFTITALDGTTKEVSFTIHGTNDAAVIGAPAVNTVTEDSGVNGAGNLVAAGTLSITDADQGQAAFQTTVTPAAGALGSLVLAADGSYTYAVANAAVQSLGATDTHVDRFTVTALDGTTRQVDFTIQGANDVAVIAGTATGSVQEDTGVVAGQLSASGQLTVTDADAGQSLFQAQASVAGTYGTFTLDAGGAWTYSVANNLAAVQALNTGQSLTDSFTAWSLDHSASQTVSVAIKGLDDVTALTGTTGNNTFSFDANGTGASTITDPGGSDTISITGTNAAISALNFERVGNDLVIQVNNQTITVLNQFGGTGNAIEQVTFASGQTFAGYALAGTYNIASGLAAGNGSSDDVIAGTAGGETLDGGGGNSGSDLLFGNAGNDTLVGQRDSDLLVGGGGSDTFVFNTALSATNVDRIADFQANATDTILLSKGVFAGLATAGSAAGTALQASEFVSAAGAATASVGAGVHVLFDTSTGNLYYDADGGSAAGRTLFATIDLPGLTGTVDASDFKVGL